MVNLEEALLIRGARRRTLNRFRKTFVNLIKYQDDDKLFTILQNNGVQFTIEVEAGRAKIVGNIWSSSTSKLLSEL